MTNPPHSNEPNHHPNVNWTRQLALAVFLLVLGTLAYWLEYSHKPKQEAQDEQAKKLFALKDSPIQSIHLINGAKTVNLVCTDFAAKLCKPGDNSKWEVTEPFKLKADDANVNSLISVLNNLSAADTIDLKDEKPEKRAQLMKEYGLDADALKSSAAKRVEIKTGSGTTIAYLGLTHPVGDNIFAIEDKGAGPDSTRVLLVPSYFKGNLDKDLTYWREKKLLTLASHDIQSFRLNGSKAKIVAERQEGKWNFHTVQSPGDELPGDIENMDSLLAAATYLSAKEFASERKDDPKAKEILKGFSPVLTLSMTKNEPTPAPSASPGHAESIVLTLLQKPARPEKGAKPGANPPGKLYATVSNLDPLFELEPSALDRLDKSVKDLRLAKLITSMERFAAKRIEISGAPIGAKPLILVNKEGKWSSESDPAMIVGNEKLQAMLDKLSGNRIKDFVTKAPEAGEKAGLTILISDEKGEKKRELRFWKSGGALYARDLTARRKEAYLIDNAVDADLPWQRDHFVPTPSPSPSPVPKSGVAGAAVGGT